jgi:hypothetical protein
MEVSNKQKKINILWSQGYNPIHLFGDVYLVRREPQHYSKWPIYLIKIISEDPIDK